MEDLEALHKHCGWHEAAILASKLCGCFFCLAIYPPSEIEEWVDEDPTCPRGPGKTAICPKCGIDSVLPDSKIPALNSELLNKMKNRWFE